MATDDTGWLFTLILMGCGILLVAIVYSVAFLM
jgi:hypothetical protein